MSCCECGGGGGVVRTAFSPASTCAGVVSGSGDPPGHGLALIDMPVVLWAPPPPFVIAIGHSRSLHSDSELLLAGIVYIPSIRVTFGTSNCATLHSSKPATITCLVIPHHLCMHTNTLATPSAKARRSVHASSRSNARLDDVLLKEVARPRTCAATTT